MRLGSVRSCLAVLGTGLLAISFAPRASAEDYPSRNITVVLGYAAGGGADVSVRYFAERLSKLAGQPVIVENKPGAQAAIAAAAVSQAKPDGYTVLFAAGNALVAAPATIKSVTFDPVKDFGFVGTLWRTPYVLVVSGSSPAKSVAELTGILKAKGDKGSYGYQGIVNLAAGELYKSHAGVAAAPISYKTIQQVLTDLTAGDIDFAFVDATSALEQVRAGRLRALAVTTDKRVSFGPDLPTMQQAGVSDFDLTAWFAVYTPPGTPAGIRERLGGWLDQILATDETAKFLRNIGVEPFVSTPDELARFQAAETTRWAAILKAAGVEPQ
jgi:tripartite-type tricarboxylate transporter receptor subunit TctC